MPRMHTPIFSNAFYHVMSRGNNRQDIYFDDDDCNHFLNLLVRAHHDFGAIIHSYCLMPNHYHLFIQTPDANLPEIMKYINGNYALYYLKKYSNKDGHVFKGRYKRINVTDDSYLLSLSRYIHLNPIRANLVLDPALWNWSSYKYYLSDNWKPVFLCTDLVLNYFPNKNKISNFIGYTLSDDLSLEEQLKYLSFRLI